MSDSTDRADWEWELGKLLHDLDMRSSARMREGIAGLGLTVAQASALRELDEPMTLRELAIRMACEPSNATVVIDKLEASGLIERRPHPTDRRAKLVGVTPEGARMRKRTLDALAATRLFPDLTLDQQRSLEALLLAAAEAETSRA